ncbi:hypothetical protein HD806DRAFT_138740 [Xylariaceae sp. AK1471]|nr:hypothetical protein HD806DRAFT_138740 [Xylariaceae sp. AK1471]
MPPPKSGAPIVTPANPRARPTATQEVIVINSDESDDASVRETSPSAKTTTLPSLHSLSWEGRSLASSTDLPIHRTQHQPSNHKHLGTPTKKTDIPAPRPRPTPGILSVPAVKDTVYRRLPVNGFSSALSLLNGQKSANTNPTKVCVELLFVVEENTV